MQKNSFVQDLILMKREIRFFSSLIKRQCAESHTKDICKPLLELGKEFDMLLLNIERMKQNFETENRNLKKTYQHFNEELLSLQDSLQQQCMESDFRQTEAYIKKLKNQYYTLIEKHRML
ncbi:MAG: hypothetical protein NZ529_11005 [Cytophagaceae bacterium]|nr:hypothetical protein [Cytophagaceae bacterium]MDW8457313.1 hypothetical protein [Cytophagaceae bacterium]